MEEMLVKEIEVTALMQILRETGIKGVMEHADCIVLNHLIERGQIGHDRNSIISSLRENTLEGTFKFHYINIIRVK